MNVFTFKIVPISLSSSAIGPPPVDGEVEVKTEQFEAGHSSQESGHLY